MYIDFMLHLFQDAEGTDAIIWRGQALPYSWLASTVSRWQRVLRQRDVPEGAVVSLEADFSPNSIALLLALIEHKCIVVPLTSSVEASKPEFRDIADVEVIADCSAAEDETVRRTGNKVGHELLLKLRDRGRPGLILFSSGSTGKSKAALHDFAALLEKFKIRRHSYRTLTFLLFDHIGGINTLFYTLSNTGCVVAVEDRSADSVCRAIERYRVQLLPTSPTFLNLLLVSEAYKRHDLSSLELITYGTEVMPEGTLQKLRAVLPTGRLLQTYGLSEVGILRSQSKSSDSLWMKIGGEGFKTRVVDGELQVQADSAMLGYLNAPSPFTDDGWFKTDDAVEVDGEYVRILGRRSEIINVGGEKVYPAEVESVLGAMDGVEQVVVSGERNPIIGQLVKASVKVTTGETVKQFRSRMQQFCKDRLARYKVPHKVVLVEEEMHGGRFKMKRR